MQLAGRRTRNTRVAFICTQDPTPLGTPGNRAYTFDMAEGRLYNASSASDIIGPIGFNHCPWFVSLVTSADLNGTGTCGRKLWLVDYFAGPQDGNSKIGVRHFAVQLGDAVNGSEGQLVTKDGTLIGDVRTPGGFIDMKFESPDPGVPNPDTRGETIVTIPQGYANLPPIPFPGIGAVCIEQTGDGGGILDCDGGKNGSHVSVRQDHFTDDEDPVASGRAHVERTTPIVTDLVMGPHLFQCPRCINCPESRGPLQHRQPHRSVTALARASSRQFCRLRLPELPGANPTPVAMCNGPLLTPFHRDLRWRQQRAQPAGVDRPLDRSGAGHPSPSGDDPKDPYFAAPTPDELLLRLTTDTATGRIIDPNGIQRAPRSGPTRFVPIDYGPRAADLTGAEPAASRRSSTSTSRTSPLADHRRRVQPPPRGQAASDRRLRFPCAADVEWHYLDACNGVETCAGGFCTAGTRWCATTPTPARQGDLLAHHRRVSLRTAAAVPRTATPATAPRRVIPPSDASRGRHWMQRPVPGNGIETCNPLTGACLPGIPLCDDFNPCTRPRSADPINAHCSHGTPID